MQYLLFLNLEKGQTPHNNYKINKKKIKKDDFVELFY